MGNLIKALSAYLPTCWSMVSFEGKNIRLLALRVSVGFIYSSLLPAGAQVWYSLCLHRFLGGKTIFVTHGGERTSQKPKMHKFLGGK